MNQSTNNSQSTLTTRNSNDGDGVVSDPNQSNTRYRERDFGVGYGSSSGYASRRSYVETQIQPFFRCS